VRFEESRPNIVDKKCPIGRRPLLPHVIFVSCNPVKTNPVACDEIEVFAEIQQGNTRLDSPNNSAHIEVFRHRPEERIIVEVETKTAVSEELAHIEKISGAGPEIENAQRRGTIEPEILGAAHTLALWMPPDLQTILGWVGSPVAWTLGIPWKDCPTIGGLLGTRAVLNEFIAFSQLGPLKASLDPRSFTIATFALCGFANFSSIGIQIGGIGALAPNKKNELAKLGIRAMLAGTMANLISASIVGIMMK